MKNLSNYLSGAKQAYATCKAKGTILSLLLTTCAAFTACTDEVENISQQSRATLQLNVGVNQPTSRAIVEGKALPNESKIGVSVVDNTGTAYQNQNFNNVLYFIVTCSESSACGQQKGKECSLCCMRNVFFHLLFH